jgi:glucose dehydrogenase
MSLDRWGVGQDPTPVTPDRALQFKALDARTGTLLWKTNLGAAINSGPMTFRVGTKQYVATVSGLSLFVFALRE